jgi:hypothetical protein
MTQAQLARELGISGAMVSKLRVRGMPTSSLAEARAWRDQNLDPSLTKEMRRPDQAEDVQSARELAVVNELGRLAHRDFGRYGELLRSAMLALTEEQQEHVVLELEVWDALCGTQAIDTSDATPDRKTAP